MQTQTHAVTHTRTPPGAVAISRQSSNYCPAAYLWIAHVWDLDETDSCRIIPQFMRRRWAMDGSFVVCLANDIWFTVVWKVNNTVVKENTQTNKQTNQKNYLQHQAPPLWFLGFRNSSFPIWASNKVLMWTWLLLSLKERAGLGTDRHLWMRLSTVAAIGF